jgi:hypothetical protein
MGKSKNKSTSTSTTNQNQRNIGAPYAEAILPQVQTLANDVMGQQSFTGDRVATAPVQDRYTQGWGTPTEPFVPQATAGQTANQTNRNWVNTFGPQGIAMGTSAATANAGEIPAISNNLFDYWRNLSSSYGETPQLQGVVDSFTKDYDQQKSREANQRAYTAGAQGAFGSTDAARNEAWAAQESGDAYGRTVAGMKYNDFLNWQSQMNQAPGQVANIANLNMLPAEQMARYEGMNQANLAGAQGVADDNTQRQAYNQWLQAMLQDENATRASANDQARLEYDYRAGDAEVRNNLARVGAQQTNDQAGLDNEYLRWLTGQETLNNRVTGMGGITGIIGGLGQTDQTMKGTSKTTSTQESQAAPWQIAAGLGGAALSAFGGGMFGGSAAALGKGAASGVGGAMSGAMTMPGLNPWLTPMPYMSPTFTGT